MRSAPNAGRTLGALAPDGAPPLDGPVGPSRANPDAERSGAADDGRFAAAVTAVAAAFGDPTRRDIFLFVRTNPAVTVSEVATAFSLHPNVARHHLERLVAGGYVEVEAGRPKGAGRPSKRYLAAKEELTIGLLNRRDDLLVLLLREAMELLGPEAAEQMAAKVGEQYGRDLAQRMSPTEGQRSVRAAMHAIAETLTAHGFAAHAEDHGTTTSVVAEQCPFGDAATTNPVLCAVDRGMVSGLLWGLCGETPEGSMPVVLSSRARGDDACTAQA
ncbi:MAG TPA: helix-turn-helix domain-containing protein [Acidimicrobiales bacterium]|nr:helix-turn-helix domain-containing protein [Acidimicrobiales bacterium]